MIDALRQWVEVVALPWLTQTWPSIATGVVFITVLFLLTFYGPEDPNEDDDTL